MSLYRVILLDQRLRLTYVLCALMTPLAGSEKNGFFFIDYPRDDLRVRASFERRKL
jgi:hypothetical protein